MAVILIWTEKVRVLVAVAVVVVVVAVVVVVVVGSNWLTKLRQFCTYLHFCIRRRRRFERKQRAPHANNLRKSTMLKRDLRLR